MPQLIIDPNNRGNPVGQTSIVQLEHKTRGWPTLCFTSPKNSVVSCYFWTFSTVMTLTQHDARRCRIVRL